MLDDSCFGFAGLALLRMSEYGSRSMFRTVERIFRNAERIFTTAERTFRTAEYKPDACSCQIGTG